MLDKAKFMDELQKYDCLYNKFSRDFKDKYKKMNCWKSLGEKFNVEPQEAEAIFKNIRTAYGRFLKRRKNLPSGSGRSDVPVLQEFGNLDWLSTFIEHRKTTDNLPSKSSIASESMPSTSSCASSPSMNLIDDQGQDDGRFLDELDDEDTTENLRKNNCDSLKRKDDGFLSDDDEKEEDMKQDKKAGKKIMKKSWANSKGKVQMTDMNNTLINTANSLSEYLQRRTTRNSKDMPEDDGEESLFCRSLIPRMKQLPKQAKAMFRLQVEQLLFHAEINHQQQKATITGFPGMNGSFNTSTPANYMQQSIYSGESLSQTPDSSPQNWKEKTTYTQL